MSYGGSYVVNGYGRVDYGWFYAAAHKIRGDGICAFRTTLWSDVFSLTMLQPGNTSISRSPERLRWKLLRIIEMSGVQDPNNRRLPEYTSFTPLNWIRNSAAFPVDPPDSVVFFDQFVIQINLLIVVRFHILSLPVGSHQIHVQQGCAAVQVKFAGRNPVESQVG